MGWKGTLRSMQAASRKADRNAQRRQRELQSRQKEYAKMEALEQAAYEVEVYENQIDVLLSVHKECGEEIDWHSFVERAEPVKPAFAGTREAHAKSLEQIYAPGFFARLFKLETRQRKNLAIAVETARLHDGKEHEAAVAKWRVEHDSWHQEYTIAQGVLSGIGKAKLEAIKLVDPLQTSPILAHRSNSRSGTRGSWKRTLAFMVFGLFLPKSSLCYRAESFQRRRCRQGSTTSFCRTMCVAAF